MADKQASPEGIKPLTAEEKDQLALLQQRQQQIDAAVVQQEMTERLAIYRVFVQSPEFTSFDARVADLEQTNPPLQVVAFINALRAGINGLKNQLGNR